MNYEPIQTDGFEQAKKVVSDRIHETENELERQTTVTERLEIARDSLAQFTKSELAESVGVNYDVARKRVEFWEATGKLTCVGRKDHDHTGQDPQVYALSKEI